ncbi:MAG: hypothetical protein HN802_01560 [Candidatus Jacksonbacteria bacterium]|jgi:hypothetical protein|nr:hypothetical protein [Candidatus Jacksonbacteria bacterium]
MAYSTKIKNTFDQIKSVLTDLPGGVFMSQDDFTGNEGIVVELESSSLISSMSGANTRSYAFGLTQYFKANGTKEQITEALSRRMDKLEYTLTQAQSRTVSGTYYWHDGQVADSSIEETDDGELVGNLTYELSITEIA